MPRKNRGYKRSRKYRDDRLIVILSEGAVTEKEYFDAFKGHTHRIKIEIIPTPKGENKSAPKYVLERAQKYKSKYQLLEEDQIWLVIDKDRWPAKNISAVAQKCVANGFSLAVSNPCFELWLWLHLLPYDPTITENCKQLKKGFNSEKIKYSGEHFHTETLLPKIPDAIKRAESMDINKSDRWPNEQGTRVYLLAKELLKFKNL